MDTVLLILRLAVATVFVVAGLAKLFDLPGSIAAVEGFGVSQRLSRPLGIGLPIAEIAIAVALIPVATAQIGAIAGTVMMGAFIVGISVNLARGKRPDCHCFGKLHSTPIGWETLARNGAIALAAGLVAVTGPGQGLVTWLRSLDLTSQLLLGLLLAALTTVTWQRRTLWQVFEQATALESRIDTIQRLIDGDDGDAPGPIPGSAAPGFLLKGIDRGMVSLAQLTSLGKPLLLVFAEPTCSVCNSMMPKLARYARDLRDVVTVAIITGGGEAANRRKVDRYGLEWVLLPENRELLMSYRVPGTPSAVMIAQDGTVATPLSFGPDEVLAVLERIAETATPQMALTTVAA